jgi:hypothetical protein
LEWNQRKRGASRKSFVLQGHKKILTLLRVGVFGPRAGLVKARKEQREEE